MTSLLDIATLSENVPIGHGKAIKVYGVNAEGFVSLWARFPDITTVFESAAAAFADGGEIPLQLHAIIAAGARMTVDAEKSFAVLSRETLAALLAAIIRLTVPEVKNKKLAEKKRLDEDYRQPWRGDGYEIAECVEELIKLGHPDPWKYTPRQMSAFIFLAHKRRQRELSDLMCATRLAQHGEKNDVQKVIREAYK